MELNNMNLPKKVYADRGHRHCAPQEDLERLADDMALLAEALRKGIALDGFGAMRKLTEEVLYELGEHACGRDYTSLSGEHSHSVAGSHSHSLVHSHTAMIGHSHSLPKNRGKEDKLPCHSCGCRCPLEGDTFYNELYAQLEARFKIDHEAIVDELHKQIAEIMKRNTEKHLAYHNRPPLSHSHGIY